MKAADEVRLIGVSAMPSPTPAKASLPATYEGGLLWPDGVFYRRMTRLDKNGTSQPVIDSYDVGR